jgi:GT2 family glycosyltransferase
MCDKPAWFSTEGQYKLHDVTDNFDCGQQLRPLDRAPYGGNMAVRKEAFGRFGLFRTDVGRCGNDAMVGEDTEFFNRLLAAQEKVMYVPNALVHHHIDSQRVSIKFLQSWYFGWGRYQAMVESSTAVQWFGVPRHLVRKFISSFLRWMLGAGAQVRVYYRLQTIELLGYFAQCWGFADKS